MEWKFKSRLNGFDSCFNVRSTLWWTKRRGRLNSSLNIVESIKNVESFLEACWIKFKLV